MELKDKNREQKDTKQSKDKALPPIVREVPDPPVPNRAHTEM